MLVADETSAGAIMPHVESKAGWSKRLKISGDGMKQKCNKRPLRSLAVTLRRTVEAKELKAEGTKDMRNGGRMGFF